MNIHPVQVARYIVGLSWMYHGFFPKLYTVAPIEKALTATIGLSDELSGQLTSFAGVAEILFGILLLIFYKKEWLIKFNILALLTLLIFTAIQMPVLLIEAFNPVTTNIALIGLSYLLLTASDKYTIGKSADNIHQAK